MENEHPGSGRGITPSQLLQFRVSTEEYQNNGNTKRARYDTGQGEDESLTLNGEHVNKDIAARLYAENKALKEKCDALERKVKDHEHTKINLDNTIRQLRGQLSGYEDQNVRQVSKIRELEIDQMKNKEKAGQETFIKKLHEQINHLNMALLQKDQSFEAFCSESSLQRASKDREHVSQIMVLRNDLERVILEIKRKDEIIESLLSQKKSEGPHDNDNNDNNRSENNNSDDISSGQKNILPRTFTQPENRTPNSNGAPTYTRVSGLINQGQILTQDVGVQPSDQNALLSLQNKTDINSSTDAGMSNNNQNDDVVILALTQLSGELDTLRRDTEKETTTLKLAFLKLAAEVKGMKGQQAAPGPGGMPNPSNNTNTNNVNDLSSFQNQNHLNSTIMQFSGNILNATHGNAPT